MKKGFTVFISVLVAVCFISMLSVSANDTGYGQFGKIYFGATSDEATFDEASFDEASFDEASPDEWYITIDCVDSAHWEKDISPKPHNYGEEEPHINKETIKKQNNRQEKKQTLTENNKTERKIKNNKKSGKNKPEKNPEIKKVNTKTKTTGVTQKPAVMPTYTGWILLGISLLAVAFLIVFAAFKRKA